MASRVRGEPCGCKTRAGGRCKKLVRGGGPCRSHFGNAPQIRRARERRIALAEALIADPVRHPSEVLADVAHQADWLMRQARAEVDADRPTAATMKKLLDLTQSAGQWAKTGLDAGMAERQTRVLESQIDAVQGVIVRAIEVVIPERPVRDRVLSLVADGLEALAAEVTS